MEVYHKDDKFKATLCDNKFVFILCLFKFNLENDLKANNVSYKCI